MTIPPPAASFPSETADYCRAALPHVSRTFALTIPLLEEPLRGRVGLAYLLCRILDTVEDHPALDERGRDAALLAFLDLLHAGPGAPAAPFLDRVPPHPEPHHEDLLRHTPLLLDARRSLDAGARAALDGCLWDMGQGMTRFPGRRSGGTVSACATIERLEAYCHVVAGTVGILLTGLFAPWLRPGLAGDPEFRENGRRFGLGLQLTNILKDAGEDRARGVIYLPVERDAGARSAVARRALGHLDAGERYVLALPAARVDMRLFCLWALHLALATLGALFRPGAGAAARASREDLARMQERTRAAAGDDAAIERLYAEGRATLLRVLEPATPLAADPRS